MKKTLKMQISVVIVVIILTISTSVFATNLNLNVDFDGKKIEMLSETPEMKWTINSLQPNQTCESTLTINSIGNKDVGVEWNIEALEEKDATHYLNIKIENKKTSEILYDGKYSELSQITVKVKTKETNTYKITISAPEENYNEIQNKKFVFKFKFLAKGAKINVTTNSEETEQLSEAEVITTDIIKPIKTDASYIVIIVVLVILVITLIVLIVLKLKMKKEENLNTEK